MHEQVAANYIKWEGAFSVVALSLLILMIHIWLLLWECDYKVEVTCHSSRTPTVHEQVPASYIKWEGDFSVVALPLLILLIHIWLLL